MQIRVATVCKNEEKIMPFFIKHYEPWVDEIIIVDGHSTDNSIKIAKELGNGKVKIKYMDDGSVLDDIVLKNIRNTSWMEDCQDFDWIISCDTDELIYHKNINEKLDQYKKNGVTMPTIEGYDMISLNFPTYDCSLLNQIKKGYASKSYSKPIIFNPRKIVPNLGAGSHISRPKGPLVRSDDDPDKIKLFHYKRLSYDYLMERAKYHVSRFSETNKTRGYGRHTVQVLNTMTEQMYIDLYNQANTVVEIS